MPHPGPQFEAILRAGRTLVDARTPAEFAKGAIAGAVNIPLFSDGERAEIGSLYKQLGKHQAIDRGLELAGPRLQAFVQSFAPYRAAPLVVYCARGGMRSQSVVALLASLGYQVQQLPGGYKAYRNYLLDRLEVLVPPRPVVLHGRTGVGKTLLLQRLHNVLDLEDIAQHRSSLFGAVNLQPRTQQNFEAVLMQRLEALDFSNPVWIEGESRKVGNALIPKSLRGAMRGAVCVLGTAPMETRVQRIIEAYGAPDASTKAQLGEALRGLLHLEVRAACGRGRLCPRCSDATYRAL